MTVENGVRVFAGIMIWLSLALTLLVHPLFWLFTAFIGLNLIQSAFTGICPATALLRKLGLRDGSSS
ncbi:MAG: DUF2892 domain-containing protein [Kiritimatiellae bacterium]|nr:DUF2892 domain-containing protein [Kiritimatiellia bacterium]